MARFSAFLLIFIVLLHLAAGANLSSAITDFLDKYRTELLVSAVLLSSIVVYEFLGSFYSGLRTALLDRIEARRFIQRAKRLSPTDKHVLSLFIDERKLTRELDPSEPSVAWLESLKLIYRGEGAGDGVKVPFRISLYAMDYFSKNPNLLR